MQKLIAALLVLICGAAAFSTSSAPRRAFSLSMADKVIMDYHTYDATTFNLNIFGNLQSKSLPFMPQPPALVGVPAERGINSLCIFQYSLRL